MARPRKLPEGMRERNGEYHADFYADGRRVRKRLSGDLKVAKELLNELKSRADRADFGLLDNDYPLEELRAQYLRHCRQALRPATVDRYEDSLQSVLPSLGVKRVSQVTLDGVMRYRQERLADDISPRTINIDVSTLVAMLRWGADSAKVIGSNPLAKIKPLPTDTAKEGRALSDEEVNRLLEKSTPFWRDVWYAFLVTGMRKSELGALTFNDVDWESKEIIIRKQAKNHRERRIPIDAGLWAILKKQEEGRAARSPVAGQTKKIGERQKARFTRDHVFVTQANTPLDHRSNIYGAFLRYCAKAGIEIATVDGEGRVIEHVDVHSLRRTFATNLIVAGADPKSVQELLGHKTLEMTMKIYTKIHTQTKRQALGKLSYGQGALAPDHVVQYSEAKVIPVPDGHRMVTGDDKRKAN